MKLFGSSGIRAVYDKTLLETAFRVGLTVGSKYHNVIVGRDTRISGDAVKYTVISGLRVRPSGTEPKIRLSAEAKIEKSARQLYGYGMDPIKNSTILREGTR